MQTRSRICEGDYAEVVRHQHDMYLWQYMISWFTGWKIIARLCGRPMAGVYLVLRHSGGLCSTAGPFGSGYAAECYRKNLGQEETISWKVLFWEPPSPHNHVPPRSRLKLRQQAVSFIADRFGNQQVRWPQKPAGNISLPA